MSLILYCFFSPELNCYAYSVRVVPIVTVWRCWSLVIFTKSLTILISTNVRAFFKGLSFCQVYCRSGFSSFFSETKTDIKMVQELSGEDEMQTVTEAHGMAKNLSTMGHAVYEASWSEESKQTNQPATQTPVKLLQLWDISVHALNFFSTEKVLLSRRREHRNKTQLHVPINVYWTLMCDFIIWGGCS